MASIGRLKTFGFSSQGELANWRRMHETGADYTHTFRNLRSQFVAKPGLSSDAEFAAWHRRWTERLARQLQTSEEVVRFMNTYNPAVN